MAIHDTSPSGDHKSSSLPLDVIIEILTWLPAKSVIRFRSVSKLWHTMTQDPSFIDAHLHRSAQARPARILLFYPVFDISHYFSAITVPGDDVSHFQIPRTSVLNLWESCNGLLCFSGNGGRILLMNPATRETLNLPTPLLSSRSFLHRTYLGFHPTTKEYKVIRFSRPKPPAITALDTKIWACQCEVYDLRDKSWRQLEDTPSLPISRGVRVGGVMYWMAAKCNQSYNEKICDTIISFDLKDEILATVSPPSFTDVYQSGSYIPSLYLVGFEGCLCLAVFNFDGSGRISPKQMDIWMLDQRTEQGWVRKYSIHIPIAYSLPLMPILINEGKILMYNPSYLRISNQVTGDTLVYHDLKDGSMTALDLNPLTDFIPFVHVDSLVPLSRSRT